MRTRTRISYILLSDELFLDPTSHYPKSSIPVQFQDRVWHALPSAVYHTPAARGGGGGGACRVVMLSATPAEAHDKYGAPASQWLELSVSGEADAPIVVEATLQLRGKQTTRLGELSFSSRGRRSA